MWLGRAFLVLFATVGAYFAATEVLMRLPVHASADPFDGTIDVYLVSNKVHVDILVPTRRPEFDWDQWLPAEANLAGSSMLAFGWGERSFYLEVPGWDDLTVGVALSAILLPTSTAMHVSAWPARPREHDRVHRLRLTPKAYASLVSYIQSGFTLDESQRPQLLDHPGYTDPGDLPNRFFAGRGTYSLFRTCNTWTNGAVQAMGKTAARWTPFERGVRYHLPKNRGR